MNDVDFITQIIITEFNFLNNLGYVLKIKKQTESNFSEFLNFEFTSNAKKRKVNISFTKGRVGDSNKFSFNATIARIPYSDPTIDFFSLNSYLNSLNLNLHSTLSNTFNRNDVMVIITNLAEALNKYALKIIDGRAWVEGYYPKWN